MKAPADRVMKLSLLLAAVTCFGIGCNSHTEKSFIPKSDLARGALEACLKKWEAGEDSSTIDDYQVSVNFFEARAKAGKKLESFEITSEEKSEGPKIFVVKLKLKDAKEAEDNKYYVVGKEPLNVFSEAEFNKASGTGK
jgi:hypothetical protein